MNDIDQKYYEQLFERARVMIQTPRYDESGVLIVHLYKSETWGKPSGWTIFTAKDAPLVNRVQWKPRKDLQQMNVTTQPASPTLVHAQTELDKAALAKLMKVGRKIRVPLLDVTPMQGINGAYYGMVLPAPEQSPLKSEIKLEWWAKGAVPWQPFTGWAFKLIELCESAFS